MTESVTLNSNKISGSLAYLLVAALEKSHHLGQSRVGTLILGMGCNLCMAESSFYVLFINFYVPGDDILHLTDSCRFLISSAFKFTAPVPQCGNIFLPHWSLGVLWALGSVPGV